MQLTSVAATVATHQPIFEIMRYYNGLIELSDRHLLWEANENFTEARWLFACDDACSEFEEIYGVELYCIGRNGRHICVEDTPTNRRNFANMKRTVKRLQNEMLAFINQDAIEEVA